MTECTISMTHPYPTMTSLLHYDALRYDPSKDPTDTLHMTSGLTHSLKANTLEGVSSECSFFIVLQSDPLFSILSFLPKDQTLKRVIKQLRESPALLNTSHTIEEQRQVRTT